MGKNREKKETRNHIVKARLNDQEYNVSVRDIEHSFCQGICALHVVEISTGRAKTGFAGKRNPANLIAAVTAVHGAVLWVSAVEDFFDFRNNNGTKV